MEAATPHPVTARGRATASEPTRGERSIIRRVAEARATVPDLELEAVADVSAWPDGEPIPTAAIVRATALALREHPRANAAYRDGHFELLERVNVAVVTEAADAYMAPTIDDADTKPLAEIARELAALAARAAAGELTAAELAGATATVTDLGAPRITRGGIVPVPPQAVALAAGAARAVPVVRDGAVVAGRELRLTLACDHRILYGLPAARFLDRVAELLEQPGALSSR